MTIWGSVLPSNRTRAKRSLGPDLFADGGDDRPPSGARGQQDGAIDVEQDQLSQTLIFLPAASPPPGAREGWPPGSPGSHGSTSMPPQDERGVDQGVRLTGKGDVGDAAGGLTAEEEEVARPDRIRAGRLRRSPTCWAESRGSATPVPQRWSAPARSNPPPRGHPAPLIRAAQEMLVAPSARAPWPARRARPDPSPGYCRPPTVPRRPSGSTTAPSSSATRARKGSGEVRVADAHDRAFAPARGARAPFVGGRILDFPEVARRGSSHRSRRRGYTPGASRRCAPAPPRSRPVRAGSPVPRGPPAPARTGATAARRYDGRHRAGRLRNPSPARAARCTRGRA